MLHSLQDGSGALHKAEKTTWPHSISRTPSPHMLHTCFSTLSSLSTLYSVWYLGATDSPYNTTLPQRHTAC